MKLLITGASGFIGSYFTKRLSKKNKIFAIINKSKNNLFINENVNICKVDLEKKIVLKIKKINTIIHCANYTPSNHLNSKTIIKKNKKIMRNIIKFANYSSVNQIIYLSSMAVYQIENKKYNYQVNEKSMLNNSNFYSVAKIKDEKILKKWGFKNKKRKVLILRIPGTVGPNSHGNFISNLKKKILNKNIKFIKIFNMERQFNNILHVDTLLKFIRQYLEKKNKKSFLILNLASKKPKKLKSLLSYSVSKKIKKQKVFQNLGNDNKSFSIDISKAIKYGFKPASTQVTLKRFLNYD